MRSDRSGQQVGQQVGIDLGWCPGCRAETTVEIVILSGDPGPTGVCVDCGDGIEMWWADPVVAAATSLVTGPVAGERPPPRAS